MQADGGGLKETDGGRQRFELELEFVQCLANPTYIHYLAQNRYFDDEAFVGYLKYLQYWQRPEYAKFIVKRHLLDDNELINHVVSIDKLLYLEEGFSPSPYLAHNGWYPHTLFFIELLQSPHFRSAMAHPANKEVAHRQQFYFWKHHRNNRLKHILPRPLPEEPVPPPPPPPVAQPTPPPPVPVKPEGTTRAGAGERRKRKYTN